MDDDNNVKLVDIIKNEEILILELYKIFQGMLNSIFFDSNTLSNGGEYLIIYIHKFLHLLKSKSSVNTLNVSIASYFKPFFNK